MKTILNFEGKNPKVYFTKILISYQYVYNTKFFIDVIYCVLIQYAYFSIFLKTTSFKKLYFEKSIFR